MARSKNNNHVTKSVCSEFVEKNTENSYVLTWNNNDFSIKKVISFSEMRGIIDAVVSASYNSNGEYIPEMINVATSIAIISAYTDIELPDSPEDAYMFVVESGVYDIVCESIDKHQYDDIINSVHEKIRYINETNIKALNTGIEKVMSELESLSKSFAEMFDGLSGEDVTNVLSAISNGGLDEEKLMRAYMKIKQPDDIQAE